MTFVLSLFGYNVGANSQSVKRSQSAEDVDWQRGHIVAPKIPVSLTRRKCREGLSTKGNGGQFSASSRRAT